MLKIKWLGQSGYLLTDGKSTICIDPYLSDSVAAVTGSKRLISAPVLPENLQADVVICTHNHLDHLDPVTIKGMDKKNTAFLAPSDCEMPLRELGVLQYTPFNAGASVKVGGMEVDAVYARHTIPAIGVFVRFDSYSLYFTGDTFYNSKIEQIKCDILFVCINGKLGNMSVSEAVKLTNKIQPRIGVPNHYGMFADNTENPLNYIENIERGFAMQPDMWYDVKDMLGE